MSDLIVKLHLNEAPVIGWLVTGLVVGWWANNGLRNLWYDALNVGDEAAQWGIAICAVIGAAAVVVLGVALANDWRP